MYTVAALVRALPFTPWRVVTCGLAFGLALDVRPGGFPILALVFVAAMALLFAVPGREEVAAVEHAPVTTVVLQGIGVFSVAWTVMVLPWPWAHENPIGPSDRRDVRGSVVHHVVSRVGCPHRSRLTPGPASAEPPVLLWAPCRTRGARCRRSSRGNKKWPDVNTGNRGARPTPKIAGSIDSAAG
jgi:hypothetical protein